MRISSTYLRIATTGGALATTGCDEVATGLAVVGFAAATALAALVGSYRQRSQQGQNLNLHREFVKQEPCYNHAGILEPDREEDFFALNSNYILLTDLEQLKQQRQKYLLVKIGDIFEFRIGALSHQEMATAAAQKEDREERELIVGAGFIWIHDKTGEIVINGKSQTFPTSSHAVQSQYFKKHLFMASDQSGLEEVAKHVRQKVFKQWGSVKIKIEQEVPD